MDHVIYGVDTSKEVTPFAVRDALVTCFEKAHTEILNLSDEFMEWESDTVREDFRSMRIDFIIRDAFKNAGVDYDNPTKEGLTKVVDALGDFAKQFRKPEIVNAHASEIQTLIDKIA